MSLQEGGMVLLRALSQDQGSLLGGQEPTWPFPKERRRYCHPQGSMVGLGQMLEVLQFLRIVS